MKKHNEIHLISHTHWDREWYLTFQQFRIRLVKLVDSLLEILDTNPDFSHFNFDGQTIVLEDYLEIKPQNRERLAQYIQDGKIAVGPWYILPDEFLVSPEATIRNLMLGHRIAEEFGQVMKVGYIPDPFGHLSQMPQILQGFGIDNIILWRGFGGEADQSTSEYYWESPDGSQVLLIHFPEVGYSETLPVPVPLDLKEVLPRLTEIKNGLSQRATTPYLLLMNGSDHIAPQKELPHIIDTLNSHLDDATIRQSSLAEYVAKVKESVPDDLQLVRGELRNGLKHTFLLTGVLSTRMYLKQENEAAQSLLEKWAEPFSSFSWMLGESYPRDLLWQSWKYLIQNHPHDSICGCSLDAVHDQMMTRFAWSEEIAEELTGDAFRNITAKIDTSGAETTTQHVTIFNPLGWERNEVVRARVDFLTPEQPKALTPVNSPYSELVTGFSLQDEQAREIPYQLLDQKICQKVLPSPDMTTFPIIQQVMRYDILFKAEELPACGYKSFQAIPQSAIKNYPAEVQYVFCGSLCQMENEYLQVQIDSDGSVSVLDKENGEVYDDCNVFEDSGDVGDEYNYSYPLRDRIVSSIGFPASIELVEQGPLRVTFKVSQILRIPGAATANRQSRSEELVDMPIVSYISLSCGTKRVDIRTEIENKAEDHRLRVLFPSGIETDFSYAEGHYDVMKRQIQLPDPNEYSIEKPAATHPQRAFVDVSDGDIGLAIINNGLPEYEVKDDACRTIALTLVRGVKFISQSDLLTRPGGNAGWPYETPGGQCLGKHTFQYAIVPHKGNWQDAGLHREAHQHNAPCRAEQTGSHPGILPPSMSFVSISPAALIVTAIKKAESDEALIVRCYNASDDEVSGELQVFQPIRKAELSNLNEEAQEELTLPSEKSVAVEARPWEINTIKLMF